MPPYYSRVQPYLPFIIKLLIILAALLLFSKIASPLPFKVVNTGVNDIFSMTGEGRVSVKPDIAIVTLGVDVSGPTVKVAQDELNKRMNQVTAELKKLGIAEEDIKTENYNIYPQYEPISFNEVSEKPLIAPAPISSPSGDIAASGEQKIRGYQANANLRVKIKNLDNVEEVIDTGTNNGANQIGGISFDIDDKSKAEIEARKKAVDEARKKAQEASRVAGFKLGKLLSYYENMVPPPGYGYGGYAAERMDVKTNSTEIQPGSMEVVMSVTLNYEIK